jgi:predicted dinucleotide-binding enzyme
VRESQRRLIINIAILGAGHIGGTLGRKWAAAGHDIFFGVRDPEKIREATKVEDGGPHIRSSMARSSCCPYLPKPWPV